MGLGIELAMPVLFASALVAGVSCTLVLEHVARRLNWISVPSGIFRDHHSSVAMGGGLAVFVGAMLIVPFATPISGHVWAVLALAAACGMLGLIDDLRPLGPGVKLLIECVLCLVFVAVVTPSARAGDVMTLAMGVLWIAAFANAFNLIDVSDGLLSGICVVAFLGWALIDPSTARLCVVFAGACAGFLIRNAPPARVFLGDTGSLMLGTFAGGLTWLWIVGQGSVGFVSAVLVFAVPLLELSFLVMVRLAKGRSPWRASRDHFAIRLRAAGWSRFSIVVAASAFSVGAASAALLIQRGTPWYTAASIVCAAAVGVSAAVLCFAPAPASATALTDPEP